MREILELRILGRRIHRLFQPREVGLPPGGLLKENRVYVVKLPAKDPRYEQVGLLQRQMRVAEGEPFFYGWWFHRYYSPKELGSAGLFHLRITKIFEPAGEECGTIYDGSVACPICRSDRKQLSDLTLDLRKVPKSSDIARTIADEWIVSQRLAQLLMDNNMTGFELRPVRHKARYEDDGIDFSRYPSGRELLRRTEEAGASRPAGWFDVWVNRPEQAELVKRVWEEHVEVMEERGRRRPFKPAHPWYQLVVASKPVPTAPPTLFGVEPFDEDPEGRYRCPFGPVSGLNILSEVSVRGSEWDGSDISQTKDMVGDRRGVLVPSPLLLVSPRLWRLLQHEKIKGYSAEVAYLV